MLKHTRWLMLVCLGLMTFSGAAQAEDEVSLRVIAGSVPGLEEVKFSGSFLGDYTVPLDADKGGSVEFGVANRIDADRPAGLVVAGGFFFREHSGKDAIGDEARLEAFGVNVGPGLFVNLSEFWHLEFKAMGGIGTARQEIAGFTEGHGPYYSYKVNAGLYGKIADKILLGAETGYMSYRSIGTADTGGVLEDTDFVGSGPTASLVVGVVF